MEDHQALQHRADSSTSSHFTKIVLPNLFFEEIKLKNSTTSPIQQQASMAVGLQSTPEIESEVDVGNFLRLKSCVLYMELEYPDQPLINVEVVAHVTLPECRSSEVSDKFYFKFTIRQEAVKNGPRIRNVVPATEEEARRVIECMIAESL
ncbi:thioesterase/thiol ester dehydrase-isomerase superfamily protein [Actinidia rufa]|uniref:Thioesterase/thiol ester dehydrase-isomerase superfamily protein n=1 Tax=Actinidia rufa TaxID=165716 RepID=A0A7J0DMY5_9ERIC|nr:thioesterase/thiol ester dehydrase-isomerase superfamily protein [Actinidia rufa]